MRCEQEDIRIIVGASSQDYPGWIQMQEDELDLTKRSEWAARFHPAGINRVLAEHVWEHLALDEAAAAARICFEFLCPGGFMRVAVPDGLFPSEDYQQMVQAGGPGPADHPAASHKLVYDRALPQSFVHSGFDVRLLEWWDEGGWFHTEPWDEREGSIYWSARFDHRNMEGSYGFTSLIIDAVKPGNGV